MNQPVERASVSAERVDDFNERRYEVTVTVIVPAQSVGEAIQAVVGSMIEIGVA